MKDKIKANFVIEILGKPADNVKEALNTIVVKLGAEKGVSVLEKKYHEPIPIKDSKDLFTAFAEINAEFEEVGHFLGILFAYMPSHVEIEGPDKLQVTHHDLSDIANKIAQRLHGYDAIAKNMIAERDFLLQKLKESAPDVFKEITTPPKNLSQDKAE